jgi:hypothetical protein
MTEHSINLDHFVQLQDTSIVAETSRRLNWIIRKAIEIDLDPNKMKRKKVSPSASYYGSLSFAS